MLANLFLLMKKILVVEEALKDSTGHWLEYDRAVVEMHQEAGIETTLLAHRQVDAQISDEIGAIGHFKETNWDGIYYSPSALKRYFGVLLHNIRVYRAVALHLKQSDAVYDCVFIPTVIIYHLIAWRWLLASFGKRKFKRLVLFFRNNAGQYDVKNDSFYFNKSAQILKKVLQSFSSAVRSGAVCLATDSTRLADEYRQLAGVELTVFPHPMAVDESVVEQMKKGPDDPVILSMLGPARIEKGIEVLQSAIGKVIKSRPDLNVKFVIQWNVPIIMLDGSEYFPDQSLLDSGRVELLRNKLSSKEYNACLQASDGILLPYCLDSYYSRISGVLIEAAFAGKPMIVTRNSWLEDAVDQYGTGLCFADGDSDELADQIIRLVDRIESFAEQGKERVAAAKQFHSTENFMKLLWDSEKA